MKNSRTFDCHDALEVISASLDGEASLEEIDAASHHLAACAGCRRAAHALEADDGLLRGLGPVRAVRETMHRPRRRVTAWWAGLAAAALCAVALGWRGFEVPGSEGPRSPEIIEHPGSQHPGSQHPGSLSTEQAAMEIEAQIEALREQLRASSPERASVQRANPFRSPASNPFAHRGRGDRLDRSPFERSPTLQSGGWTTGRAGRTRRTTS